MENVFTAGTEGIILNDPFLSLIHLPINEDWAFVVEIVSVDDGLIVGKKVWDTSPSPKLFYAKLERLQQEGKITDEMVAIGSRTIFYRVGDFNNNPPTRQGLTYELHEPNTAYGVSFVCFASYLLIFVEDMGLIDGEEKGREVVWSGGGFVPVPGGEVLSLQVLDPVSSFHGTPPYKIGRRYWGMRINQPLGIPFFLVSLAGYGNIDKTFSETISGTTYTLSVDGSGKVVNFTVSG